MLGFTQSGAGGEDHTRSLGVFPPPLRQSAPRFCAMASDDTWMRRSWAERSCLESEGKTARGFRSSALCLLVKYNRVLSVCSGERDGDICFLDTLRVGRSSS